MTKLRYFLLFFFACILTFTQAKTFTVVLDPGHGGKDPGALGSSLREKDVNLAVALLVGQLIEKSHPDVKVVYTRKTDQFVTLQERPKIANKANADIFISIHSNAAKSKSAYGAEVFTIGLDKNSANFEVAKRENSVILLEENYKETYEGFDPTSPESYIMFEFMQSQYIEQSLRLASWVQSEFVACKRHDRGVRQDNFWVLHQTKMPSILIELGFVTNANEEKYLLSEKGRKELSNAIYKGIIAYKTDSERRSTTAYKNDKVTADTAQSQPTPPQEKEKEVQQLVETTTKQAENKGIVFKVQLFATKEPLKASDERFKGYKCDFYKEGGMYKYTYGNTSNFSEIQLLRTKLKKLFDQAFIIAFKDGVKINMQEALQEIQK